MNIMKIGVDDDCSVSLEGTSTSSSFHESNAVSLEEYFWLTHSHAGTPTTMSRRSSISNSVEQQQPPTPRGSVGAAAAAAAAATAAITTSASGGPGLLSSGPPGSATNSFAEESHDDERSSTPTRRGNNSRYASPVLFQRTNSSGGASRGGSIVGSSSRDPRYSSATYTSPMRRSSSAGSPASGRAFRSIPQQLSQHSHHSHQSHHSHNSHHSRHQLSSPNTNDDVKTGMMLQEAQHQILRLQSRNTELTQANQELANQMGQMQQTVFQAMSIISNLQNSVKNIESKQLQQQQQQQQQERMFSTSPIQEQQIEALVETRVQEAIERYQQEQERAMKIQDTKMGKLNNNLELSKLQFEDQLDSSKKKLDTCRMEMNQLKGSVQTSLSSGKQQQLDRIKRLEETVREMRVAQEQQTKRMVELEKNFEILEVSNDVTRNQAVKLQATLERRLDDVTNLKEGLVTMSTHLDNKLELRMADIENLKQMVEERLQGVFHLGTDNAEGDEVKKLIEQQEQCEAKLGDLEVTKEHLVTQMTWLRNKLELGLQEVNSFKNAVPKPMVLAGRITAIEAKTKFQQKEITHVATKLAKLESTPHHLYVWRTSKTTVLRGGYKHNQWRPAVIDCPVMKAGHVYRWSVLVKEGGSKMYIGIILDDKLASHRRQAVAQDQWYNNQCGGAPAAYQNNVDDYQSGFRSYERGSKIHFKLDLSTYTAGGGGAGGSICGGGEFTARVEGKYPCHYHLDFGDVLEKLSRRAGDASQDIGFLPAASISNGGTIQFLGYKY